MALWSETAERSRTLVAEAIAEGGLDRPGVAWPDGRTPSLRRLLIDLIEEYGRHIGHADLIRESVDGLVEAGSAAVTSRAGRSSRPTGALLLPAGRHLSAWQQQSNGRRPTGHARSRATRCTSVADPSLPRRGSRR